MQDIFDITLTKLKKWKRADGPNGLMLARQKLEQTSSAAAVYSVYDLHITQAFLAVAS